MTDALQDSREAQDSPALDEIDRRIIAELQDDGRRTYGRIAEAVGLTEAPTRQRVARLTRSGLIEIVAITNPGAFGFRLRVAVGLRCEGDLDAIAAAISEVDEVDWLVATAGRYDLMAELRCVDEQHLYGLLAERIRAVRGVRDVETLLYLNLFKASYSWPPGSGRRVPDEPAGARRCPPVLPALTGSGEEVTLDATDRRIVAELQEDGRRTYGRIAEAVGLSLAPTRQRVARLIDTGVIKIAAIINPRKVGFLHRAAIGLRCEGDLDVIAAAITQVDEVEWLMATAGGFDLMAEVSHLDAERLHRLVTDRIRTVPGVRGVEILLFLSIFKVRYPWPPGMTRVYP
ncbi:Lrp/AsnC family transcriptional regulator [Nonomuraea sediminis]|uniref:Lrp/AsnC family transcriptional regulator n=1 Tax=Nonomuraea sediminis TaxID=2835864 RepID=UPI001BDD8239|nr:Lrp/AsnC family transcriptional regulator [Nonomuraea sediminis]